MREWTNTCINYSQHLLRLTLPIFFKQMYNGKRVQCRQKCADQLTAQELFTLGSQDSVNYVSPLEILSKALHLVTGMRHTTAVPQGARQERCWQAAGTCVVRLPCAASRLAMLTLISVSHIQINSAFIHIVCQPKLYLSTDMSWNNQQKGPFVSYSTCQVRIESVIPQMVYGSETHPVTTLRQWIESTTICKNYTFLWRSINMLPDRKSVV